MISGPSFRFVVTNATFACFTSATIMIKSHGHSRPLETTGCSFRLRKQEVLIHL
jgi:hypothetical protein